MHASEMADNILNHTLKNSARDPCLFNPHLKDEPHIFSYVLYVWVRISVLVEVRSQEALNDSDSILSKRKFWAGARVFPLERSILLPLRALWIHFATGASKAYFFIHHSSSSFIFASQHHAATNQISV